MDRQVAHCIVLYSPDCMKRVWILCILTLAFVLLAGIILYYQSPGPASSEGAVQISTAPQGLPPLQLSERIITLDGKEVPFRVAEPFQVAVAAEGLGKVRFMAMSPDGRMFVPDMVNMNLSREGKIYIFEDFNSETKRFEKRSTYMTGLRGPNSIAFYTDSNEKTWIYITLTDRLMRYPYKAGDTAPQGEPEILMRFPDYQSPTAIGTVWHITRTLQFKDDTLYVSVGSGCNACEQPEDEQRALIWRMDADGSNARVYATGIKNAVGIEWARGALFATENGVDNLGEGVPDDVVYKVEEGVEYGWPYCYEQDGEKRENTTISWGRQPRPCAEMGKAFSSFLAHTAPLGITYFENMLPVLKNSFLIALHGSFDVDIGNGYQLIRMSPEGVQDIFMDGFLNAEGERIARPVDILQKDERSFFFTDDFGGRIFYVYVPEGL